jgi:hypothetical protein
MAELLLQGLLPYRLFNQEAWGFTLMANLYICRAANFCQEA